MSIKRIKFLQRTKILQQHVQIQLSKTGARIYFQAKLQLSHYTLPPNARIYIDAYQLMERIRFDLGTVGMPNPMKSLEISSLKGARVHFDLVVVDGATGRKVANADKLKPVVVGGEAVRADNSLLPVDTTKGLDGLYWRIDYCEKDEEGMKDAPVLLVDEEASLTTDLMGDVSLRVAVLPSAMREILGRVLLVDEHRYEPGGRDWRNSWLRFATRLVGDEPPSLDVPQHEVDQAREECDAWIQRAVELFCTKHAFLKQFLTSKSTA